MKLTVAALALGLAGLLSTGSASSNVLVLTADNSNSYQQGVQNPCIFTNTSCTNGTFTGTALVQGGNIPTYDAFVTYSGATLLNIIGVGNSLILGIDINQASGQPAQTLSSFQLLVNGKLTDTYDGTTGNVPATSNGNGYADYILSNFSTFLATDTLRFNFLFTNANDGTENVFIASRPGPLPIVSLPEPGSLVLFSLGLLGLALGRKKLS